MTHDRLYLHMMTFSFCSRNSCLLSYLCPKRHYRHN